MRFLFTFGCIIYGLFSFAQSPLNSKDQAFLSKEIQMHVNDLRSSLSVHPLGMSDTLRQAAILQANYQANIDEVTHSQKKVKMSTPAKRVQVVKGKQFILVGENCLSSSVDDFSFTKKELKTMAFDMFTAWKNSPGHYKNMINTQYTLGGFGFAYNAKSKMVYATQVFADRGVLIEGQLSEDAFGIYPADEDCHLKYRSFKNLVTNMGNSIQLKGDDIYLMYSNKAYFEEIFPNKTDGIAIDIVMKNQFDCSGPSRLDLSPVYDGVLLKPMYKDDLLKNNEAKGEYRLVTKIGELPPYFDKSQEYQFSLIVLDKGESCMYVVPAEVPSRKYNLRPIEPFISNNSATLVAEGILFSQEVRYDFERNNSKPVKYPTIRKSKLPVSNVEIFSFTSVEGDSLSNSRLHDNRAKTIKNHLKKKLSFLDSNLYILAKENWEKMNFQMHYYGLDSLLNWEKDSLRKLVSSSDSTLNWSELLFEQRRSMALIHHTGRLGINATLNDTLSLNLKTAIADKNWSLANKALYEIYHADIQNKDSLMFSAYVFEACQNEQIILENALAVYSQIFKSNMHQTTILLHTWITKGGRLTTHERSNMMHLYTLLNATLINEWDLPSSRLARVIQPNKIEFLISEDFEEELMLNIHLSFIQYYGQTNDRTGISNSFSFIANYFREHSLSQEDDVDLCLFFNSWSRYDLTTTYLYDKFKADEINEDGVFLLLQTSWFYGINVSEKVGGQGLHEIAMNLNKERYCLYINNNYQNLRDEDVKALFCKECL